MMRFITCVGLACLISFVLASTAMAHKVNLFAYVEGGRIYTESYFPDGRPVQQGQVELRTLEDSLLVAGTTNEKGLYDCLIPQADAISINIIASMGHRNSFLLKKSEIEAGR